MKQTIDPRIRLQFYIKEADVHAHRTQIALSHLQKITPFSTESLEAISDENLAFLDLLSTRFSKLQDVIGARIFPILLTILKEEDQSFIDKLHKLERLRYLPSSDWWSDLRELRNDFTLEYPTDPEKIKAMPELIHELMQKSGELLDFWSEFKIKVEKHLS